MSEFNLKLTISLSKDDNVAVEVTDFNPDDIEAIAIVLSAMKNGDLDSYIKESLEEYCANNNFTYNRKAIDRAVALSGEFNSDSINNDFELDSMPLVDVEHVIGNVFTGITSNGK